MRLDSSIHRRRIFRLRRRHKSVLFFERLEDRLLLTVADLPGGVSPGYVTSFVPGEIIVKFDDGGQARASGAAQLLDSYSPGSWHNSQPLRAGVGAAPWQRYKLAEDADVLEVARQLSQLDGVVYAEPNYRVSIDLIPNDASFSSLWGLHNTGQTGGTVDADIDAPEAWDTQTGSLQTVVGVIDSGIDYRHPDLYKNIWLNQGEIPAAIKSSLFDVDSDNLFTFVDLNDGSNWQPGNAASVVTDLNGNGFIDGGDLLADPDWADGIDADGNNYPDDLIGWDFVNNDNDPLDENSHGTHVSGTIGGTANNSIGVAGVNWQVRLMGIRFLDAGGGGTASGAVDAIYYAIAAGANLTNNSWGGNGFSQAIYDAIAASGDADMLFVAAAGNNGIDNDGLEFYRNYPSSYDLDNIIAVAASDHNDQYADFSNYGAQTVDLAAPGVSTLSTTPNGTYSTYSGTSMATPHVAGAAALLLSENPNLSSSAVKQALLNSVDPISGNPQATLTNGRLNVLKALNSFEDDSTPPAAVTDLAATGSTMSKVGLTWSATGDDGLTGTASSYDLRYATSPITEANWSAASQAIGEPTPQASGSTENFVVGNLNQNTGYYFALKVRDNVGNESGLSNVLLASTSAGTVVFEDDMENGPGAWVATGLWHQSAHRSNSPTNAWYYGQESVWNYDTGNSANSGTLTSQTIDLSNTDEAFLSFSEWSEVEDGTEYDRTRVQLSSDGNSWTTVFESHGTSNTWRQRQIDLANYVGGAVQLRYFFDTIDQVSNTFEGWYLDDVKVVASASGPGINVTPTSGLQTTEAGGQASFNVVLTAPPSDDVTIGISSSDPTEGTVSASQLVFTAADWNQPKTVVVTGLDDPESPTFVDGNVAYTIVTAPASSSDPGYANLDASDVSVTNLDLDTAPFQIEHGVITVPASGATIPLDNTYVSPVVITTPNYGQGAVPAVVRLDNVSNDSFDIHVVNPTGTAVAGVRVHYVVVEQGSYTLPGGVQLEASTFGSSVVDGKNSWTGHVRDFANSYQNPVVLGQVMSSNDPDWSVFWSSSVSSPTAPPSGTSFVAGLHVGEDPDTTRVSETIGYLVLDSGSGELDGIAFESGVGADIVRGMGNGPPYTYSLSSLSSPDTAIVSQVAMDGNDGSWALLYGDTPLGASTIQIAADEDQLSDTERSHTTEQAAYLVLKDTGPPLPALSIGDVQLAEGDSGTTNAVFTVSLSAISGQDVTVDYATANGSATAGQDYASTAGTLTIAAGSSSGTITVPVSGDTLDEFNETFAVNLSSPTNATIADGSGSGTILDDDAPPTLSIDDVSVNEGNSGTANAVFTVTLSSVSGKSVTVNYATADGSAAAGQDYATTAGTLTIAAGSSSATITVPVLGDTLDEFDETFDVNLSSPGNATIADGSGTGTILDDDAQPTLSIDDVSVTEGNSGTANAVFTVTLSAVSAKTVTVDYATSDGSATAGQDYATTVGTLTIAAGSSGGTIAVPVIGDTALEGNETFAVNLSGPTNATIADGSGTGTILDDDAPQPTGRKLYVTLEHSGGDWQPVALPQSYTDMVVVGTPNYDKFTDSAVVRVRQAAGNSFSFKVQRTSDGAALSGIAVHFLVIEAGVYPYDANTGTPAMEAVKYSSTVTDRAGSWNAEPRSYQQPYSAPVVVGQVMSDNDAGWSVFWSRGGSKNSPPSSSVLRTGKHVGEDYDTTRADETIGYVVMETGYAFNGGYTFTANVGSDTVLGMQNAPPYTYTNHPYGTSIVIASQTGMDGNDGGWAVLYGSEPVTPDTVKLAIDEDTIKDSERRHTSEQVAFLAFELPPAAASLAAENPGRLRPGDPRHTKLIKDESLTPPAPVRRRDPAPAADSLSRLPTVDSIPSEISLPPTSFYRDDVVRLFGKLGGASREEWNLELFGELNSQHAAPWDDLMFDDLARYHRRR